MCFNGFHLLYVFMNGAGSFKIDLFFEGVQGQNRRIYIIY